MWQNGGIYLQKNLEDYEISGSIKSEIHIKQTDSGIMHRRLEYLKVQEGKELVNTSEELLNELKPKI